MSFSVAPGLLIAMPSLQDPNFARTVVLLCVHNADGAFGVVVNKPLKLSMSTVCEEAEIPWSGTDAQKAFRGGPVDIQRGWVLREAEEAGEEEELVCDGIAITSTHEALAAYGADPEGPFRLVLGCAGWGPGQLDGEITEGSWMTAPATAELLFHTPHEAMWEQAMRSVGIDPARLVETSTRVN